MKENIIIPEVNPVAGFDPSVYARELENDDGSKSLYLDVKFRLLWFRLCYPEGKIVNEVINMDSRSAVVCCRLYAKRTDEDKQYLSKAYAQRFFSEAKYGERFLEFAETAAVGRALAYAGFGTQFCSGGENGDGCIDSPLGKKAFDLDMCNESANPPLFADNNADTNFISEEMMTCEKAKSIVVDFGCYKGKTLGEIVAVKPADILWFAKNYVGNNKEIQIGAEQLVKSGIA